MEILRNGLSKPGDPRIYYDEAKGWCVEADVILTPAQVKRCADWAFRMNLDRWRSLPPGDRKDTLGRILPDLQQGKVQQVTRKKYVEMGFD